MSPATTRALAELHERVQADTRRRKALSDAPKPDLIALLHAAVELEARADELEQLYRGELMAGKWEEQSRQLGLEKVAKLRATAAWLRTVQP